VTVGPNKTHDRERERERERQSYSVGFRFLNEQTDIRASSETGNVSKLLLDRLQYFDFPSQFTAF